MAPRVIRVEDGAPFTAMGGEIHRLIHPSTTGAQRIQMSHVRQGPGESIRRHRHEAEEAYFVLAGRGVLYMEDHAPVELVAGLAVFVPSGVAHHQLNTGDTPLLLITAMAPPLGPGDVEFLDG